MSRIEFTTFAGIGKRIDLSIHVFYWPTEFLAPRVDKLFTFQSGRAGSFGLIDDVIVDNMQDMWIRVTDFIREQDVSPILWAKLIDVMHSTRRGQLHLWAKLDEEYSSTTAMSLLDYAFALNSLVLTDE